MRFLRIIIPLASLLLAACGGSDSPSTAHSRALDSVTGDEIRRHMEVLADDAMEGREAGTEGFERAAAYVAGRFEEMGLEPIGDDGGYYQSIDFFETRLVPESARATIRKDGVEIDLVFRDDFVRSGGFGTEVETVTAPLVFVGYGIIAPEYDHDDFAGVDVEGKILVVLSGAPPLFDTDQRAFYSSRRTKQKIATGRGAVGLIGIRTPVDQKRRPWERYLPGIGRPNMRWLDETGQPHEASPGLKGSAALSEAGAARLFGLSGHDLEVLFEKHAAGETGSFDLGVSATLSRTSRQRTVSSPNVIGLVRGDDPVLRDEYIVFTAHLDHIGVRPGENGDDIHNGAYDNAAGVAALLEIAEAMATVDPPRRSVIFAAVTAEEKGLQGSSYFAKNPPVSKANLVANVNIDMPYLAFPVADIEAFGAEHSSLLSAVNQATAEMGLQLTPDPMPEEVRFVRSDQFSFVQEGIPAVAFKAGSQSSDPAFDGREMLADFLKNHYHRASDDLELPYSSEGAEKFVQAALLLGLYVGDNDERPRWNDGDFFGDKFSR